MCTQPEDENKFEYTIVHGKFQELVDALLTDFLEELGVNVEEFFKIATDSKDKLTGCAVYTAPAGHGAHMVLCGRQSCPQQCASASRPHVCARAHLLVGRS